MEATEQMWILDILAVVVPGMRYSEIPRACLLTQDGKTVSCVARLGQEEWSPPATQANWLLDPGPVVGMLVHMDHSAIVP